MVNDESFPFRYRRNCWKWIENEHPNAIESVLSGGCPDNPVHVEIHPHCKETKMCNNHCSGCTGGTYRSRSTVDFGLGYTSLMDCVKSFKGRVDDVIFSGCCTEPLLYPNIENIIHEIHKNGSMFSLYSNFYYADRGNILEELTSPSSDLDYIRISINAGSNGTYNRTHMPDDPNAFKKVQENVRELLRLKGEKKCKMYVHLTYLLDRHNSSKEETGSIVKWAAENRGIDGIRFGTYQNPLDRLTPKAIVFSEREVKQIKDFVGNLEKDYGREDFAIEMFAGPMIDGQKAKTFDECNVRKFFPVIGFDGGVYTCTAMASPFNYKNRFGNINNEDFWDIWDEKIKTRRDFCVQNCYDCTRAEFDINEKVDSLLDKVNASFDIPLKLERSL